MIDLGTVVSAISEKGIRLFRTATGLRVEGNCPPDLLEAIRAHQASLRPFAAAAEEVKAVEASNCIRQQLETFALAMVQRYLPRFIDEQLAQAVDTQDPATVTKEIARLKDRIDVIDWACEIFPFTMETEAKHAVAAEAGAVGELSPDAGVPF